MRVLSTGTGPVRRDGRPRPRRVHHVGRAADRRAAHLRWSAPGVGDRRRRPPARPGRAGPPGSAAGPPRPGGHLEHPVGRADRGPASSGRPNPLSDVAGGTTVSPTHRVLQVSPWTRRASCGARRTRSPWSSRTTTPAVTYSWCAPPEMSSSPVSGTTNVMDSPWAWSAIPADRSGAGGQHSHRPRPGSGAGWVAGDQGGVRAHPADLGRSPRGVQQPGPAGQRLGEEPGVVGGEVGPLPGDVVLVEDGLDRADRLAGAAVDALVRLDVERSLPFVDAVDRALFDAGPVQHVDARLGDDVGHPLLLSVCSQVDHVRVYRAVDLLTRIGSRPVRSARGSREWTRPKSRTPSAAIPTGPWLPGRLGTPFPGVAGGNGHVGDAQVGLDERAHCTDSGCRAAGRDASRRPPGDGPG